MMRRFATSTINFITQPTWKSHPHILKPLEIIPGVSKEQYWERIVRLCDKIPMNSSCIIPSYRTKYSTQNIFYPFQQNNNLLYLTGFMDPDSCLHITKMPSGPAVSLFVTPNDAHATLWSGPRAGIEGAREIFGIQNVYCIEKLKDLIEEIVHSKQNSLFIDYSPEHSSLSASDYLKIKAFAKPIEPLLRPLRMIKSHEEIELMKRSSSIASESFQEVMKYSLSAKNEAELASFMEFKVRSLGGDRLSYVPVVAGSDRGLVLHYTHNNQLLSKKKEEDMLLMDAGALYFGYCSDITRTWPLSGHFSNPQAKLYEAVLAVQTACLEALQKIPNVSLDILNDVASYVSAVELEKLGFKNVESGVSRWFPHSIGHHLGLDLHDCPNHDPRDPLVPGNMITIEPGLYIPHQDQDAPSEFKGLAIRIEDDLVITNKNEGYYHNMTSTVPKTISDLEKILKQ